MYLPLYKVAYTPFHIQGDDLRHIPGRGVRLYISSNISLYYNYIDAVAIIVPRDCYYILLIYYLIDFPCDHGTLADRLSESLLILYVGTYPRFAIDHLPSEVKSFPCISLYFRAISNSTVNYADLLFVSKCDFIVL